MGRLLEKARERSREEVIMQYLTANKEDIVELIKKKYTDEEIIKLINKHISDEEVRKEFNLENVKVIKGKIVREFLKELRRELRENEKQEKKQDKKEKKEEKTTFSSKPKIPELGEDL